MLGNMTITKQIYNDATKRVGLLFTTEDGMELAVPNQALKSEEILNWLLNNGYILTNIVTMDFIKDSESTQDLPIVFDTEVGLDATATERFIARYADIMPDTVIAKQFLIQKELVQTTALEPLQELVTTKEELIKFLNTKFEEQDYRSYFPLNALCKREALLDYANYKSPEDATEAAENRDIIKKIEDRRTVTLYQHNKLVELFKGMGMKDDFDYVEFLKYYLSWGICGFNEAVVKVNEYNEVNVDFAQQPDSGPVMHKKKSTIAYTRDKLLSSAEAYSFASGESNRLYLGNDFDSYNEYKKKVTFLGNEEIVIDDYLQVQPLKSIQIDTTEGIWFISLISYRRIDRVGLPNITRFSPYRVSTSLFSGNTLPADYYNFGEDAFKKILTQAAVKDIIKKTTDSINLSSYDILLSLGVSPSMAINYVLKENGAFDLLIQDFINIGAKEVDEDTLVEKVGEYLKDDYTPLINETKIDEEQQLISSAVQDVIDGLTNCGGIANGSLQDAVRGVEDLEKNVEFLHTFEHRDLHSIKEELLNASDAGEIKHRNKISQGDFAGDVLTTDVSRRNATYAGAKYDLYNNRLSAADEAMNYLYITGVLKDLQPRGIESTRDVGFIGYLFERAGGTKSATAAWEELSRFVEQKLNEVEPGGDWVKALPVYKARALFEIALTGKFSYPEYMNLPKVECYSLKELLIPHLQLKVESIANYNHQAMQRDFYKFIYCPNAIITPEHIIPQKGQSLTYFPFIPWWILNVDLRNNPATASIVAGWIDRGLIPADWYGAESNYTCYSDVESWKYYSIVVYNRLKENGRNKGLDWYYAERRAEMDTLNDAYEPVELPSHLDMVFPRVNDKSMDEAREIVQNVKRDIPAIHKWNIPDVVSLTQEQVLEQMPELTKYVKIEILEENEIEEDSQRIRRFKDLDYDTLVRLGFEEFKRIFIIKDSINKLPCKIIHNKPFGVTSGKNVEELTMYNIEKAMELCDIVDLGNREYLLTDDSGNKWVFNALIV